MGRRWLCSFIPFCLTGHKHEVQIGTTAKNREFCNRFTYSGGNNYCIKDVLRLNVGNKRILQEAVFREATALWSEVVSCCSVSFTWFWTLQHLQLFYLLSGRKIWLDWDVWIQVRWYNIILMIAPPSTWLPVYLFPIIFGVYQCFWTLGE